MSPRKVSMGHFDPAAMTDLIRPFSEAEYAGRLTRIREMMARENIDLLYVTMPEEICYIHGYMTSWYKANSPRRYPQLYGTAIHVDHDRFIHFDHPTEEPVLYKTSISRDNRFFSSREAEPNLAFIMDELRSEGWLKGKVGLEFWSYIPNRAVGKMLDDAFCAHGCEVVDGSGILREVRRLKSPREIACIEEAVRMADIGHQTIQKVFHHGMTELELYGEVLCAMMAAGSEHQALIPIFTSIPVVDGVAISGGHLQATRKKIKAGEHLAADLCGVINGYHGNVCRGYYIGDPPKQLIERYQKAAGAYAVIREKTRAGIALREFSRIMQDYYKSAGLWDAAGWALGYELGLSFPPDWVGEFFFDIRDAQDLDRIFEEHMVTNFESFFNTTLIDTIVWETSGARTLSTTHDGIMAIG